MARRFYPICNACWQCLRWGGRFPSCHSERIVVEKSAKRLSILRHGQKLKSYRIALGQNPIGAKEQEGDLKTPEGIYQIDSRNPQSSFHLGLHISYPSAEDTAHAVANGVP